MGLANMMAARLYMLAVAVCNIPVCTIYILVDLKADGGRKTRNGGGINAHTEQTKTTLITSNIDACHH